MRRRIDGTHDAALRSWVESANEPGTDFPLQNLPLGVFRRETPPRIGCAIGDEVLDLAACVDRGLLRGLPPELEEACLGSDLNRLLRLAPEVRSALRPRLSELLRLDDPFEAAAHARDLLQPRWQVEMLLPARIGDYTDFYASLFHATNVGRMLRPDHPLLPNYKWLPVGYHGRASSLVVSGTTVARPLGQSEPAPGASAPGFGPSRQLDYELEVGALLGPGNELGRPIPIAEAEGHLFGLVLLNDWSARDLQKWEYQPLGPFLAKSFATTISTWVVTLEALAPYRVAAAVRPAGDPAPLPHLDDEDDRASGAFDLRLEVLLASRAMQERRIAPACVGRGNLKDLYWTFAQMVAHHGSNGCNLRPGDLVASGTVSGPAPEARGCLLERTWRGTTPLVLPTGEERRFLEDGDLVVLRGHCAREGFARIGFGECRGLVGSAVGSETPAGAGPPPSAGGGNG